MASMSTDGGGNRTVQFVGVDGKRRSVRLGKVPKKLAESVKLRVEHLAAAAAARMPLDPDTAAWVGGVGDDLHDKLAAVGLVPRRESSALGAYLDAYLDRRRADRVKGGTVTNLVTVTNDLRRFFGEATGLRGVTPTRADEFKAHLLTRTPRLAADTVSRRLTTVRAIFKQAVKFGLTSVNPFADVAAPSVVPADRERYVAVADAEKIIAGCDTSWAIMFALARYAGLRCPSEVLSLKWEHVDLPSGRMTVPSPKTEHRPGGAYRVCPVFARLRPYLEHAFELAAGTGAVYVVPGSHREAADTPDGWKSCNLRTQAAKLVNRAGLALVPKLFHNLRASCQNDLNEVFPEAIVCRWLGNSRSIARRHYVNPRDVDFEWACRAPTGGGAESGAVVVQNPVQSAPVTRGQNRAGGKESAAERGVLTEPDREGSTMTEPSNGRYWIRTSDFHRVRMAL